MAIIKVDTDEIRILAEEGGKLVLAPEADIALYQLFRMKALIDGALETAGEIIKEQGLGLNPDFVAVAGDHAKATYRAYGAKYEMAAGSLPGLKRQGFVERKVSYSLNTKEVDKYLKAKKKLPKGVTEVEREKKISLKAIETGDVPEVIEA